MSTEALEHFRTLLTESFTIVAVDVFNQVQTLVRSYEDENKRLKSLLNSVLQPEVRLPRIAEPQAQTREYPLPSAPRDQVKEEHMEVVIGDDFTLEVKDEPDQHLICVTPSVAEVNCSASSSITASAAASAHGDSDGSEDDEGEDEEMDQWNTEDGESSVKTNKMKWSMFYPKQPPGDPLQPVESDDSRLKDSGDEEEDSTPTPGDESSSSSSSSDDADDGSSSDEDANEYHDALPGTSATAAGQESAASTKINQRVAWKTEEQQNSEHTILTGQNALTDVDEIGLPIQYFRDLFYSDLSNCIVEHSNTYYTQQNPNSALKLDHKELEQFIGTLVYMSVSPLPRSRMYWSGPCRLPQVADVMSRVRWEEVKRFLHFRDHKAPNSDDKLLKIRSLIYSLLAKFRAVLREEKLCFNEQMVPFKGRSGTFFDFVEMVIVNSWLLYRRDCESLEVPKKKQKDLLRFRTSIAQALCMQGKDLSKKTRGQPSLDIEKEFKMKKRRGPAKAIPSQEIRSDAVGHVPVVLSQRQRCKLPLCKGHTVFKCEKCDVHLCLNKHKNCFRQFHE